METKNKKSTEKPPVVIEIFESPTCSHCAVAMTMLAEAKKIYGDDIKIFDINILTKNGQLAAKANDIKGTPTIYINNQLKFQGEPKSINLLYTEIEKNLSEESIKKANNIKLQRKKRIDMMYS